DDGACQLLHLDLSGLVDLVRSGREQHLRLEDETVSDNADVLPIGEDFAEPAEEVGAIAVQLLDTLCQRHVQAPSQIGDLGVGLPVLFFRRFECVLQRRDLLTQGCDLLVEDFDLGERALADLPFSSEFAGKGCSPRIGRVSGAGALRQQSLQDRKSTRLNSSHVKTSYVVFCVKEKSYRLGARLIRLGQLAEAQ